MLATIVRHKHRKEAFETLRILTAQRETGAASSKEETFTQSSRWKHFKSFETFPPRALCVHHALASEIFITGQFQKKKKKIMMKLYGAGKMLQARNFLTQAKKT